MRYTRPRSGASTINGCIVGIVLETKIDQKSKGGTHTMGNGLDLRCLPNGLVRGKATLRVNEVRRENSVDERRLAQTSLA